MRFAEEALDLTTALRAKRDAVKDRERSRILAPTRLATIAGLLALTLVGFWPVISCGFVNLDDGGYVSGNPHVLSGLSADNVAWAFINRSVGYYLPLTWLSLMLDATVYPPGPAGFHVTNLVLQVADVLLLLGWLAWASGDFWRSFAVAALFALSPLRAESVAWVTERKDVLGLCFGLLALIAYTGYTRAERYASWRRWCLYAVAIVMYAMSLLAKPMLVTLPPVLLILDLWPLRRQAGWQRRLVEKIPFFLVAAIVLFVAVATQADRGQTSGIPAAPALLRYENGAVWMTRYAFHSFALWGLAPVYPMPAAIPLWQIVLSLAVALAISIASIRLRKRVPYLLFGWGWYLLLLPPMLGLVANGIPLRMADRFTLAPGIGLTLIAVWWLADRIRFVPRAAVAGGFAALLITLTLLTRQQCGYWHDDLSLFAHTLQCTRDNWVAEEAYGAALCTRGQHAIGMEHLVRATQIEPRYALAHYELGRELTLSHRDADAIGEYRQAIRWRPDYVEARSNLAERLLNTGQLDEAAAQLQLALQLDPTHVVAWNNLGCVLLARNDRQQAANCFRQALAIDPNFRPALINLRNLQRR